MHSQVFRDYPQEILHTFVSDMVDLFLEAAGCGLENDQDVVVTTYDVIAKRRATSVSKVKATTTVR
jgi:hypothetical protein